MFLKVMHFISDPTGKMSGGMKVLAIDESDVTRFLNSNTHIGSTNVNFQMQQYVWKRRDDG